MPPMMLLTIHRTASSFLNREVLDPLARDLGWERADPFGDAKRAGIYKFDVRIDPYAARRDVILGPVRHPHCIADIAAFDDWTKIMVLRHPLDVLTSYWFYATMGQGMAGVGVVGERLVANRARALEMGRDAWLRDLAPKILERYEDYRTRFAGRPNLTLLRYEDLIADWPRFLARFTRPLDPSPSNDWMAAMVAHADTFVVAGDSPAQHKRQIRAGDHLRKLDPEIIAELSALFEPVLAWLETSPAS